MSQNPYASPTSTSGPDATFDQALEKASRSARFVNGIVDTIVVAVLGAGAALVIGVVFVLTSDEVRLTGTISKETARWIDMAWYITMGLVFVGYYVLTETFFQRTLGKLITGTKVIDESGGRPRLSQAFRRTFLRLTPFEAFTFLSPKLVGWHDSLSKTLVVKTR